MTVLWAYPFFALIDTGNTAYVWLALVVALPVSGGTRMQEGTVAFLQMIGITAAVARHKAAGLPYLVYLRHPTFGGVLDGAAPTGSSTWTGVGFFVSAAAQGLLLLPVGRFVDTTGRRPAMIIGGRRVPLTRLEREGDVANFIARFPGLTPNAHVALALNSANSFSMTVRALGATPADFGACGGKTALVMRGGIRSFRTRRPATGARADAQAGRG